MRVRSTDEGALSFEKIITVTVSADGDDDGLQDAWELTFGTLADFTGLANGPGPGAGTGDFDDDGSPDIDEFTNGTAPNDEDSDDDGLNDGDEDTAGTDPLDEDTDKDGLKDGEEATHESDPLLPDTDEDTILDGLEVENGTDPAKRDTDEVLMTTSIPLQKILALIVTPRSSSVTSLSSQDQMTSTSTPQQLSLP